MIVRPEPAHWVTDDRRYVFYHLRRGRWTVSLLFGDEDVRWRAFQLVHRYRDFPTRRAAWAALAEYVDDLSPRFRRFSRRTPVEGTDLAVGSDSRGFLVDPGIDLRRSPDVHAAYDALRAERFGLKREAETAARELYAAISR